MLLHQNFIGSCKKNTFIHHFVTFDVIKFDIILHLFPFEGSNNKTEKLTNQRFASHVYERK
jgi:hypothetical protein